MIKFFTSPGDLSGNEKKEICCLIFQAFKTKFRGPVKRITDEKWPHLLQQMLTFNKGILYITDEKISGAALLSSKNNPSFQIQMRKELGFIGNIKIKFLFDNPVKDEGEIKLEMLAVDSEARGQGIGSKLIEIFQAEAEKEGKKKITLEVVDTNPGAKKLYDRLGFTAVKKVWTAPFTYSSGFKSYYLMEKIIRDN